jgi:hypothetical protein
MRILPLISLFFFLLGLQLEGNAQNPIVIVGHITNKEVGGGVDGAVITCKESSRSAQSDKGGRYAFKTLRLEKMQLEFRLLGYETRQINLDGSFWNKLKHDTLLLNIEMVPKSVDLPGITLYPQKVDTVFGTMSYFVEDYEFYGNQFVLLTFEKSLKKASIKLADESQKVLSTLLVPGEAVELYKDFQGYINVMCKEHIYRLLFEEDGMKLGQLPEEQFRKEILPCADTLKGHILFSNYYRNYPAFSWFSYQIRDTSVKKLKYIKDKDLLEMYEEEFDFLKPRDRLNARKLEISSGIDKRIIAAEMAGFPHSLYYTPLYAPLFVSHDTAYVFDHYANQLFRFDKAGVLLDSLPISYHHPKDWKEWKHKLLQDRVNGNVYAVLQRGGFYLLRQINLTTGTVFSDYRLKSQYANHLKIHDRSVYYIYRPSDSGQTKFLYREKLPD